MKGLIGLKGMARGEITELLDRAARLRSATQSNELAGRSVGILFFEPSTRTRLSFELATLRLGANPLVLDPDHSSLSKGESLQDTVMTTAALGTEIMVVRHADSGVPASVQEWTGRPVINAGDGTNEHPTQALADLYTLMRRFGEVDGLSAVIVGDVAHSRVAGSLSYALSTMGVDVTFIGPAELLPERPEGGVGIGDDLDEVIGEVDVVYLLRVQGERGTRVSDDYSLRFGLTQERADRMKDHAIVMHPGPINRGVEISDEVADGPRSLILEQVANGVPVRMAVLSAVGESL